MGLHVGSSRNRSVISSQVTSGSVCLQVVVVVSDGRSIDDPAPAARELRKAGVKVLAMGIGNYVNMHELELIAARKELAFRNDFHQNDTIDGFVRQFREIAIGEFCDFARGTCHRFLPFFLFFLIFSLQIW